jgi:hypothetical protein
MMKSAAQQQLHATAFGVGSAAQNPRNSVLHGFGRSAFNGGA